MGLALALASAWTATQGLKTLIGKPRPDLLARCDPDVARVAEFTVSGLGESVRGAATLVSWEICRVKSDSLRIDGFASFPSGHSSCKCNIILHIIQACHVNPICHTTRLQ
jgi:membrane-associated phospholipid phosphatase